MEADKDYYDMLGLFQNATLKDIDKAYKKCSLQHHPDKNLGNPSAHEQFISIRKAYDILKDPKERLKYDISRPYRPHKQPSKTPNTESRDEATSPSTNASKPKKEGKYNYKPPQEEYEQAPKEEPKPAPQNDQLHKNATILAALDSRLATDLTNFAQARVNLTRSPKSSSPDKQLLHIKACAAVTYFRALNNLDKERKLIITTMQQPQRQDHLDTMQRVFEWEAFQARQTAGKEVLKLLEKWTSDARWTCKFKWDWLLLIPIAHFVTARQSCMFGPW